MKHYRSKIKIFRNFQKKKSVNKCVDSKQTIKIINNSIKDLKKIIRIKQQRV